MSLLKRASYGCSFDRTLHGPVLSMPDWLEEIDHTADLGYRVTAPAETLLFERAATGLMLLLTNVSAVEPVEKRTVSVTASDRTALMRTWLAELNFLHIHERVLFSTFEVTSLTETALRATVGGEAFDPERHDLHTEIKAVTYHGLDVRQHDGRWEAQVIVDM